MSQDEKEMIEYQEVIGNMRHYSNMRFAYLTLFFAATATFGSVLFTGKAGTTLPFWLVCTVCTSGVIITVTFLICELRTSQYWGIYKDRAIAIEQRHSLGCQKNFPTNRINSTFAVKCVYISMFIIWCVIFYNLR